MAEGVCSSSALENDGNSKVSSLVDSSSEITKYDSVFEASVSLWMEVEPYPFEPEKGESDIVGEIEDSVEMDISHATRVGNNNWYIY